MNAIRHILRLLGREAPPAAHTIAGPTAAEEMGSSRLDGTPSSSEISQRLDGVRALLSQGNLWQAEAECRSVLEKTVDGTALAILGFIAQQTGRFPEAVEACNAARQAGHLDWSNELVLGFASRGLGRHEDAFEAFSRSVALSPDNFDALQYWLEAAVITKPYIEAEALYNSLGASAHASALAKVWKRLVFEKADRSVPVPSGAVACVQMTAREWCEMTGGLAVPVEGISPIPVEAPIVIGEVREPFQATIYSNDPYYAELRDVRIFSHSNIVLTADGYGLNETGAHAKYGQYVSHQADNAVLGQRNNRLLIDTDGFAMQPLDAGIMLSGAVTDAFGHWLPEYLARLQFLEHHPEFSTLPIIVDADMPQSHFDYLACIVSNELIRMQPGTGFRCQKLVYAPPPTFFPVHLLPNDIPFHEVCPIAPSSYRYLKAKVEAKLGVRPQSGGKYFLSRRHMSWRRISNDAEISSYLENQGYQTIFVESLKFEEQVRLFQGATDIVAPNGSSMQNIIFSDPSVNFLVLSQDHLANLSAFYAQTAALGYKADFLCGPSAGGSELKHVDYVIEIDKLAGYIERSGRSS